MPNLATSVTSITRGAGKQETVTDREHEFEVPDF
jgi:hypothetical protein